MLKEWHFEEKVYKRWMVFMVGPHEEFVEALKQVHYDEVDDVLPSAGYNIRLSGNNSDVRMTIIWLPKFGNATLAHELVHYVMHTFYNANVPIEYGNEEAFAYYLEYWMREVSRVYKRYPNGRSPAEARKT